MTDKLVPTVRTVVSLPMYARAVLRSWHHVGDDKPSKATIAVLWAQYMIETGGRDSWGWNIGNTKEIPNDGINYHALRGVWEGVSPAEAERLISSGQAVADPSADHAKAVGAGRVSVVFQPPHPATWFSSFLTLDDAMAHHLKFLARRFAVAWPAILSGDYVKFAHALKSRGYFTADANSYANGMRAPYFAFMNSPAYDEALAVIIQDDIDTQPDLDNPDSERIPVVNTDIMERPTTSADQPTIHPDPSSYLRPEEWEREKG